MFRRVVLILTLCVCVEVSRAVKIIWPENFTHPAEDNSLEQEAGNQEDRGGYGYYRPSLRPQRPGQPPCATRLGSALDNMRLRQLDGGPMERDGVLELRGVSLHQPLQGTRSVDMYISEMSVKGLGQSHLERCRFTRSSSMLSTQLMFDELLAKGTVRLRDSSTLGLLDYLLDPLKCNMTMRMRLAPLELNVRGDPRPPRISGTQALRAAPRMSARFLPESDARTEFRGCEEPISHRRSDDYEGLRGAMVRTPYMVRQMELAFLQGIREIMALYMERTLKSSMTDTLMSYLGFTISYG